MFDRIKKFNRYQDYYAFSSLEVKMAILFSVIFIVVERQLEIYENIYEYSEPLMNLILYIISGEFCLFGMVLAGMALVISIITKSMRVQMKKQDKEDMSERILSQFEFSAFNLVLQIIYLFIVYLFLSSKIQVIDKKYFIFINIVILYHLFFNMFYVLQLIGNCIKINNIKEKCDKIDKVDKSLLDVANEIRIDYILVILLKEKNIKRDDFVKAIDEIIEKGNYSDSKSLKEYLHNYYQVK